MTTLTIKLSEDLGNHLKTLANQVRISPEDLAQAVIEDAMQRPSIEFEQLLDKLLHRNVELYQRLASL
jgi:predicted transcriptional regulator